MSSYGRDDVEWDTLADAGRAFLVERARLERTTSYTELNATLANRTGLRPFEFEQASERAAMGHLLYLIVQRDQQQTGDTDLMLSALVIYLDANDAGSGFYSYAQQLGLLSRGASKGTRFDFWINQVKGLLDRYKAA